MKKRKIALIAILLYVNFCLSAENNFVNSLFKGVYSSNFREVPINEVFPYNFIHIPKKKLSKKQHPYLLFKNSEIYKIRQKIKFSPYKEWFSQIQNYNATTIINVESPFHTEMEKSKYAKFNAFEFILTENTENFEKAKKSLLNISEPDKISSFEGGSRNSGWGDWMQAAQALTQYSTACDLIYNRLEKSEIDFIENRLAAMTIQLYDNLHFVPKNNHAIIISIGIATSCLVIEDNSAQKWFDKAIEQLECSLSLIQKDGGYKEGAYYANFTADKLFPFLTYYYNFFDINLFEHKRIRNFTKWIIDTTDNQGDYPLFDDAFANKYFYKEIAVGLSPYSSELKYLSEKYSNSTLNSTNLVEAICFYENNIPSRNPYSKNSYFYEESGNAIFRSKNSFGFFLYEDRNKISDHDHIEPLNFTLSAFSKKFIIDPGYGKTGVNNPNREFFLNSKNHNIPLVNGFGGKLNPVYGDKFETELISGFSNRNLSKAGAVSFYRNSLLKRNVLFCDNKFYIVIDETQSNENQFFSFNWNFAGDIIQNSNQLEIQQDQISLNSTFLNSENNFFIKEKSSLNTYSEFSYENSSIEVKFPSSKEVNLVSLFIPQNFSQEIIVRDSDIFTKGNYSAKEIDYNSDIFHVIASEKKWHTANLASDSKITYYDESSEIFSLTDVSFLEKNNRKIFQAEKPLDITIFFENNKIFGEIYSKQENSIKFDEKYSLIFNEKLIKHDSLKISPNSTINFRSQNSLTSLEREENFRENYPVLMKIKNSPNPQETFNFLNKAEKTQVKNEIIAIINQEAFEKEFSDNLSMKKLYSLISGLIKKSYNSGSLEDLQIPHNYSFETEIKGNKINYREAGFFKKDKIVVDFQEMILNDKIYLRDQRIYDNHHRTSFEIAAENDYFHSDFSQLNNQTNLAYRKSFEKRNYFINLQNNKERKYFQIDFSQKNLTLTTSGGIDSENRFENAKISGKYRISKNIFNLSLFSKNIDELSEINFKSKSQLNDKNFLRTSSVFHENQIDLIQTKLFSKFKNLHTKFSFHSFRNLENELKTKYSSNLIYNLEKWRFEIDSEFSSNYQNEISLGHYSKNKSWLLQTDESANGLFEISHSYLNQMRLNHLIKFNEEQEIQELRNGFYFYNQHSYGFEFSNLFHSPKQKFKLTFFSYQNFEKNLLYSSFEYCLNKDFQLQFYKIKFEINSNKLSPGLLISRNKIGTKRYEGYLCLRF